MNNNKMKITPEKLKIAKKRLLQMHYESGVGHIGGNLSCLDSLLILLNEFMGEDEKFILSKGHAAGALYISLWCKGLLCDDDLKTFHKDNTNLPGHPPSAGMTGVQFATGSLGHGLSLAAGVALAKRLKKLDGHVYCMMSDGEWQEGSTWEALIFLNHHRLDNLTILIDHNGLQGFGGTHDVASMSPLVERIKGFDIDIDRVPGHDLNAIRSSLARNESYHFKNSRIIILESVKGHGVSFMENKMEWHYLPLTTDQYLKAIKELDCSQ